jgi:antitoxin (DNA-binding transcriptional repressor) of toxin-antitoxin stability system
MTVFTIHEAKTNLSKLIKLAEAGEEVVIARGKTHVARVVAEIKPVQKSRGLGVLKHLNAQIPDNLFLEPLSQDELAAWGGRYSFDP